MGIQPETRPVPCTGFKSLEQLARYRNLCLWLPVPIVAHKAPWGYYINPSNPKEALPDAKALACFIQARKYLKSHSYQIVSQWMTSCGFPISDDGVLKLYKSRPMWPELNLPLEERMKI